MLGRSIFFFNDTATTEIYTLSLHDALPIWRLRTAGTEKSFLDPFQPERPEDMERLRTLLQDLHGEFRGWVSSRRGAKLKAPAEEVFTGRFWPGRRAVELGLADRLGDARGEARRRFGPNARLIPVGGPRRPLLQRLPPSISAEAAVAALEERVAWARLAIGRTHVRTPVTPLSRMPSSA